jgi:hypothetical protein
MIGDVCSTNFKDVEGSASLGFDYTPVYFCLRNRSVHVHSISNSWYTSSQMAREAFLLEIRRSHDNYNESFCFLKRDAVQFCKYAWPFQRKVYHVPPK